MSRNSVCAGVVLAAAVICCLPGGQAFAQGRAAKAIEADRIIAVSAFTRADIARHQHRVLAREGALRLTVHVLNTHPDIGTLSQGIGDGGDRDGRRAQDDGPILLTRRQRQKSLQERARI